eukprot:TRINITY_DN1648_c0_g2_i10.p1 TRINITY_DN1648_c0_g2~~TRINITY_DN1648_c0_g2_i10.p1  ORF type:complete len:622 (+),score=151.40 TRINITY_DN1648_c0_g2_i10:111-1868(+)
MSADKISGLMAYPSDNMLAKPEEIWKFCSYEKSEGRQKKLVKLSDERIPFATNLVKVDAKLGYKFEEDSVFERRPAIMYRMRRGLSFVMDGATFKEKVDPKDLSLPRDEYRNAYQKPKRKKKKKKKAKEEEVKKESKEESDNGEGMRNVFNQFDQDNEEIAELQEETKEAASENAQPKKEPLKEIIKSESAKAETSKHEEKLVEELKTDSIKEPTREIPTETSSQIIKESKREDMAKVEVGNEKEEVKGPARVFHVVRKGLQKFFDIDSRCFAADFSLPAHDNKINYLLAPVQQHFLNGNKIQVYATRKANGENAQISYIKDFWCISSKNVSLCARTEADLVHYKDNQRYQFALAIALVWFKIVDKLRSSGKLESFKQHILSHTMIGEYVGNVEHQHLVRYSKESILMYAIVDNEGVTDCLSPDEAMNFFDEYEIDHVSYELKGVYITMPSLLKDLQKIYVEMALETLDNEEEGLVLYIATKDLPENYTISLCKIKTLEYRIYRKIRENLKYMRKSGNTPESFKKNCTKMVKGVLSCVKDVHNVLELLPMPFNYYLEVANTTFGAKAEIDRAIAYYTDFNGTFSY